MRITKVKVATANGKQSLRFKRDSKWDTSLPIRGKKGKGQIVDEEENAVDIARAKKNEFEKSVFNSIVVLQVKEDTYSYLREKLDALTTVLKARLSETPLNEERLNLAGLLCTYKTITGDDLNKMLTRKGRSNLRCDGRIFSLKEELLASITGLEDFSQLNRFFTNTKGWYAAALKKKKENIVQSIKENRISFNFMLGSEQLGVSKRKVFINDIIRELQNNANHVEDLVNRMAEEYGLNELVAAMKAVALFYTDKEVERVKNQLNLEYKRCLQAHQSKLFGKDRPDSDSNRKNPGLQFFHNELTKYFELYFPINKGNHPKQAHTKESVQEYVGYYIEPAKIIGTLVSQLRNAVWIHLRELGHLVQYYYGFDTDQWTKKEFESSDLQVIKIKETLKRKISNDICFAANNLFNQMKYDFKHELVQAFVEIVALLPGLKNAPNNEQDRADYLNALNPLNDRVLHGARFRFPELAAYLGLLQRYNPLATGTEVGVYNKRYGELYRELTNRIASLVKAHDHTAYLNEPEDEFIGREQPIVNDLPIGEEERKLLIGSRKALYYLRNIVFHVQKARYKALPHQHELMARLRAEVAAAKASFIATLKSNNVLSFYGKEVLEQLFKGKPICLDSRSVAFAPSLKNVLERANTKLGWDIETKERTDRENARYYLVNLLYYQYFLPAFVENREGMFVAAKNALEERNEREKQEFFKESYATGRAYEDLLKIDYRSPQQYLAAIQAAETDRNTIQRKAGKEKEQPYFQRFVHDLFAVGFGEYLQPFRQLVDVQLGEQDNRHKEFTGAHGLAKAVEELKDCVEVDAGTLGKLDTLAPQDQIPLLYWYILCSLLDRKRLNSFRNDLLKYEQAVEKFGIDDRKIMEVEPTDLLAIINLCMLRADAVDWKTGYKDEGEYIAHLKNFLPIENREDLLALEPKNAPEGERQQMYVTGDGFVTLSGVEKTRIYGTLQVLKKIAGIAVSKEDIEAFYLKEKKAKGQDGFLVEKTKLHEKWAGEQQLIKQQQPIKVKDKFTESDRANYIKWVEEEVGYLRASNRVNLLHVDLLNNLLQDIFSHWISSVYLFEREMYSLVLGLKYYNGSLKKFEPNDELGKVEAVVGSDEFKTIIAPLLGLRQEPNTAGALRYDAVLIRNRIAHFEYFRSQHKSLLELLKEMRQLLSFDRKLKNAVTKSFIDLFDSYGMVLKLEMNHEKSDELSIASLTPKKIYHLKEKRQGLECNYRTDNKRIEIVTDQVAPEFCTMCEALLTLTDGK